MKQKPKIRGSLLAITILLLLATINRFIDVGAIVEIAIRQGDYTSLISLIPDIAITLLMIVAVILILMKKKLAIKFMIVTLSIAIVMLLIMLFLSGNLLYLITISVDILLIYYFKKSGNVKITLIK